MLLMLALDGDLRKGARAGLADAGSQCGLEHGPSVVNRCFLRFLMASLSGQAAAKTNSFPASSQHLPEGRLTPVLYRVPLMIVEGDAWQLCPSDSPKIREHFQSKIPHSTAPKAPKRNPAA